MFGSLFVVPFFLERALGQSAGRSGLELTVMPVALGVVAPLAGRLADRLGARPLTVSGMAVSAASLVALALFHRDEAPFLLGLVALGAGLGLFTPPNNAAIIGAAPREQSGVASGVLNMTRGMGTAMGLAVTSLVFGLVAGATASSASATTRGFQVSALFLAAVAVAAALLAAMRGRAPLSRDPLATAE